MSTERLLRTHTLVSMRWRVRRIGDNPMWFAHPVGREGEGRWFDSFADALVWAREQHAIYGGGE